MHENDYCPTSICQYSWILRGCFCKCRPVQAYQEFSFELNYNVLLLFFSTLKTSRLYLLFTSYSLIRKKTYRRDTVFYSGLLTDFRPPDIYARTTSLWPTFSCWSFFVLLLNSIIRMFYLHFMKYVKTKKAKLKHNNNYNLLVNY